MKKFDLKAALNGEPVKLRNGRKAVVQLDLTEVGANLLTEYPLRGYVLETKGIDPTCWTKEGKYIFDKGDHINDIVEMWEEPKLTSEQVLEKAYNEDLLVLCDGNPDLPLKIIAKTKDGEFVMQPEDDTIQPWLANLTMEWFFAKDIDPKFDTITNTIALPKPFKPKENEVYYVISPNYEEPQRYKARYLDHCSIQNGNCFRTREDAQKWLDFMKSMME